MQYIALLRGINVGNVKRIEMKRLREVIASLGYEQVLTYINSGNVLFQSIKTSSEIRHEIEVAFEKNFGCHIPTLVKTEKEIQSIAKAIPIHWKSDAGERSDVAYLFEEVDTEDIVNQLPLDRAVVDIRYTKGAVLWNLDRKNYNQSHLNKLIGHKYYQLMTIRNVNTARVLAKNRL